MLLKTVSKLFLPGLMTGDWREADWQPVWLDLTQGRHPEGGRYPDGEGWYWCHRGVPRARSGLHLLHWSVPTRRHTWLITIYMWLAKRHAGPAVSVCMGKQTQPVQLGVCPKTNTRSCFWAINWRLVGCKLESNERFNLHDSCAVAIAIWLGLLG